MITYAVLSFLIIAFYAYEIDKRWIDGLTPRHTWQLRAPLIVAAIMVWGILFLLARSLG